jgi:outer membrane receptor protein involved in Fe transport
VHRGSLQIAYNNPKLVNVTLGFQFVGLRNDDRNVQFIPPATLSAAGYPTDITAGLPGYSSVDLMVSKDFGSRFQVFAGWQNITDKVYFVQTNPSTVGTPVMATVGVRVRFSAK